MNRIPGGTQTYSKHHSRYGSGCPKSISRAGGPYVWDGDRPLVDYVCGMGSVILGHAEPEIDAAVRTQLDKGISYPLASSLEEELAEMLVDLVPGAERSRFAKNGADATSAAVRCARAVTSREGVVSIGYHGYQDWSLDEPALGVPRAVRALRWILPYGDLEGLEAAFAVAPNNIACLILEPVTVAGAEAMPPAGYLEACRALCDQHGALLVYDEIVTGFRVALGGAQEAWKAPKPDLICLGKAMGNGFPISALVGNALYMNRLQAGDVFFSTTFGGDCVGLSAAIATLSKLRRDNVLATLAQRGQMLKGAYQEAIRHHELESRLEIKGYDARVVLSWREPQDDKRFKDLMLRRGNLMQNFHNLMWRHSDDLIRQTCRDISECLEGVAHA